MLGCLFDDMSVRQRQSYERSVGVVGWEKQ